MTRQVPWLRVFVEGVVIVGSILLAFGIDAAWEERQEREEERALIQEIRTTLSEDLEGVTQEADTMIWVNEGLQSLIQSLEAGAELDSVDPDHQRAFLALHRFVVVTVRYGPFETLKARGFDLVSNPALRVRLTSLYENQFPRLIENSEIDRRLSRERILPYMVEYLELDTGGNWVARQRVPEARSLGLTLARYRLETLVRFYLPSFETTIELMKETLDEIDAELRALGE